MRFEITNIEVAPGIVRYLTGANDAEDGGSPQRDFGGAVRSNNELPFVVELWNPAATCVETVLAVCSNVGIGYAAFYGAASAYPHRHIVLRHDKRVLSRWHGKH
jgi:hypothetical protein